MSNQIVQRGAQGAGLGAIITLLQHQLRQTSREDIVRYAQELQEALSGPAERWRSTVYEMLRAEGQSMAAGGERAFNAITNQLGEIRNQITNGEGPLPDLSDLIPQNDPDNAQVGDRRGRDGQVTSRRGGLRGTQMEMEIDREGNAEPQVAAFALSSSNNPVSKETQITPAQATYGLQETHVRH